MHPESDMLLRPENAQYPEDEYSDEESKVIDNLMADLLPEQQPKQPEVTKEPPEESV